MSLHQLEKQDYHLGHSWFCISNLVLIQLQALGAGYSQFVKKDDAREAAIIDRKDQAAVI
jgi:hypothetical protein